MSPPLPRVPAALPSLLLLGLLVACGQPPTGDVDGGVEPDAGQGTPDCALDADCPDGEVCLQESCWEELQIAAPDLPEAYVGSTYSYPFETVGGVGSATWSIEGKPAWAEFEGGTLTGEPDEAGSYLISVTVTDALGQTTAVTVTLQVFTCEPGTARDCYVAEGEACHQGAETCGADGVFTGCEPGEPTDTKEACGVKDGLCGACDTPEAPDCRAGVCGCGAGAPCADGTVCCGGTCISPLTDPNHCGGCAAGTAEEGPVGENCEARPLLDNASGWTCRGGGCEPQCDAGWDDCDQDHANGCETDLYDEGNCGTCGTVCSTVGATGDGNVMCGMQPDDTVACGLTCSAGRDDCNWDSPAKLSGGQVIDGCETDLTSDAEHCGACNDSCTPIIQEAGKHVVEVACEQGSCVIPPDHAASCDPLWGDCDGDFSNGCELNLITDSSCGACNSACRTTRHCDAGSCVCDAGLTDCGGTYCTNLDTSSYHCGACGNRCASDQSCQSGVCVGGCQAIGAACALNAECCSNNCVENKNWNPEDPDSPIATCRS